MQSTHEINELKKKLKRWELSFLSTHDRKPGKADIESAPERIQDAYRRYTHLKREAGCAKETTPQNQVITKDEKAQTTSEKPPEVRDMEVSDTWGCHLNKTTKNSFHDNEAQKEGASRGRDHSGAEFLHKLHSKLFASSLKLANEKPEKKSAKPPSSIKRCNDLNTSIDQSESSTHSKTKNDSKLKTMDSDTVKNNKESRTLNNNPFSDGFEENFPEFTDESDSLFNDSIGSTKFSQNKPKINVKYAINTQEKDVTIPKSYLSKSTRLKIRPDSNFSDKSDDASTSKPIHRVDDTLNDELSDISKSVTMNDDFEISPPRLKGNVDRKSENLSYPDEDKLSVESISKNDEKSLYESDTFVGKTKSSVCVPSIFSDTSISESKETDIKSNPTTNDGGSNNFASGRIRRGKRKISDVDSGDDKSKDDTHDEEGDCNDVKGQGKSGDEVRDDTEGVDESKKAPISKKRKTEKAPKKIKPASNDNFVRLNMKIKGYRRKGKQGLTGPQHKRKMWKEKMAARSKSYGDKCFKCGESGHWASKCKGKGKSRPTNDIDSPFARSPTRSTPKNPAIKSSTAAEPIDYSFLDDIKIRSLPGEERTVTPPEPVAPLVEPLDDELPDAPPSLMAGLAVFGHKMFREGQELAIRRIMSGMSTLVVLSTGMGKSLCYKLPAYLYAQRSPGIALVISPLVSLMEDQITGLPAGVRGACIHNNMSQSQRDNVTTAVVSNQIHFLLISPESLAEGGGYSHGGLLQKLPPVAFACIDEAHCLSEWSHNFRPSYLRICKVLRENYGVKCFLGLTATATASTAIDVAKHLGITDLDNAVIRGNPIPKNLFLSSSRDENRDEALVGLLQSPRFEPCDSIIVYCTRRDETERLAALLRTSLQKDADLTSNAVPTSTGIKRRVRKVFSLCAESYHAGLSPAQRKRAQVAFMSGKLRIVVATVAFGMGLDKSDVRAVIHYNMPKSFESYVQEIGRAGRDGLPSQCHVFLNTQGNDLQELRRHIYGNTLDRYVLKRFVSLFFKPCRCREIHKQTCASDQNEVDMEEQNGGRLCTGHERAIPKEKTIMDLDIKEESLCTLLCYLELHPNKWLLNLPSTYATCVLQCYQGPAQLQTIARKCPPVGVAIAQQKKEGRFAAGESNLEFAPVDVADSMGWDSGPVKRELRLLQWNLSQDGGPSQKTGIIVEFSDLAFHLRSPGDLTDDERDAILDFLHTRVVRQEKTELWQLNRIFQALTSVSFKSYWMSGEEVDMKRDKKIKQHIDDYFATEPLSHDDDGEGLDVIAEPIDSTTSNQLHADINSFINTYGEEHSLNARVIARILHGIASPCFPAQVWGRVRRYWRAYLHVDFYTVLDIAKKLLVNSRL